MFGKLIKITKCYTIPIITIKYQVRGLLVLVHLNENCGDPSEPLSTQLAISIINLVIIPANWKGFNTIIVLG